MYKHSNNNREAKTLHKCVKNGTSAQVTSSAGIFDEPIARGQYFIKHCPLGLYRAISFVH